MREVRAARIAPATIIAACLLVLSAQSAWSATGDITTVIDLTAGLSDPAGLSCDGAGNLYVADSGNDRILRRDVGTGAVTTAVSGLNQPTGILVDKAGNIYIANSSGNNVLKVDALTSVISVIGGNGSASTTGDGGNALLAGINSPCGLAMDAIGNLYVAQRGGGTEDRVRRIDLNGNITTVAGGGVNPVTGGASATSVAITFQLGGNYIGLDLAGNLFIADESQNVVYRVNTAGTIAVIGGTGNTGFSGDGGPATAANIDNPTSLCVDITGNVFVNNDVPPCFVRKIDITTQIISRAAGTGVEGYSGDGGPGILAQIQTIGSHGGMCVDKFGHVYFSDFSNNVVRRLETVAFPTPAPGPVPTFVVRGTISTPLTYNLPGTGPFTFTPSTGLPPGLSVVGNQITGTPTTAGTYAVDFQSGPAAFRIYFVISSNPLTVGNNGGGPLPIPRFKTIPSGGTSPVDIVFDPSDTYLPVSGISNQRYLYQARWDYGDGTGELVPAQPSPDPTQVLQPRVHTYIGDQDYAVRLTILVFIEILDANGNSFVPPQIFEGPNAFTDQGVRVTNSNYQPNPSVFNTGSQIGDGNIPFTAQITPSFGTDQDGYIIWAAIDWGDGTVNVIPANQLPPNLPTIPLSHTYNAPGTYKVTVSVIDNGRIPLGFAPPFPATTDPFVALAYYKAFQQSLPLATLGPQYLNVLINPLSPTGLSSVFDPQLRQDFMFIIVPGNMTGIKGSFTVDFGDAGKDTFSQTLKVNIPVENVAGQPVTLTLGSGASAITKTFTPDRRGRFREQSGFSFSFNPKKQIITLKFKKASLAAAFGRTNATVVNAAVDIPVTLTFGTTTTLKTTLTYAYNSKQGDKGTGKGGLSKQFVAP
ncbi:MAG TPA: hypothetical protein VEJ63_02980 [Planctomycetota bacterium]|nr:hypothetical protein [Planctomycetota bacterium]